VKARYVVLAAVLVAAVAFFLLRASIVPVKTEVLAFPRNVGSILVLVDRFPSHAAFASKRAEQVAIGLRYLTPRTTWAYIDAASPNAIHSASAVVYLGLDGLVPLAPANLSKLRVARYLIVSEHHIRELHKAGAAFDHVMVGLDTPMEAGTQVRYRDLRAPVSFAQFLELQVTGPAKTVAHYVRPDGSDAPYIVADGSALFVNGPLAFNSSDGVHGDTLAACDAIATFLGAPPNTQPLAMLRLEDVSAITSPWRMGAIAYYLWRAHVPYGIGVIPDLRVEHGTGGPLRSNPLLVMVLRWAQDHGATIVLHGLHHCCSSQDAEGYEFWDFDRRAPVPGDSAAWMRAQITEGLADERALGLRPAMWETPHYAASSTDYAVVSQFFAAAWESRDPDGWLPWPLQRDQYGSAILPENLGYVSLDGSHSVNDQLTKAQAMLACRYCLAAGFLHPALLNVQTVAAYVQGLRELGYAFVDPEQAASAVK
jgi:hypothetical protein